MFSFIAPVLGIYFGGVVFNWLCYGIGTIKLTIVAVDSHGGRTADKWILGIEAFVKAPFMGIRGLQIWLSWFVARGFFHEGKNLWMEARKRLQATQYQKRQRQRMIEKQKRKNQNKKARFKIKRKGK